jgi:K+-transporting ATPase ATPase A chain
MDAWLFIGALATVLVVLALAYRPLGNYMARVYTSAKDWRIERGF